MIDKLVCFGKYYHRRIHRFRSQQSEWM